MKTVLITGGATGIGAAVSSLFAENGYNVIINFNRSRENAEKLKAAINERGGNAEIFQADITSPAAVTSMYEFAKKRFGGVDVLVNNAGISSQKLFTDISPEEWDSVIRVNLTGAFNCCKAVVGDMIRNKNGVIINVSSIWGETGASCEVHYSAAKAGIIGFTKALAKEMGPSGIRVNCVAPGFIDTDMNAHLSGDDIAAFVEDTPLCRTGSPEEVAASILFLASDAASFITGQVLSVNGGHYI